MVELIPFNDLTKVTFTDRPKIAPIDLRYFRKVAIIVLVLKLASRGEKSSVLRVHFFNWALASEINRELSLKYIADMRIIRSNIIPFDPVIQRAIEYAIADGFIRLSSNAKLCLGLKGENLVNRILADGEIFNIEKDYLYSIGKVKAPEAKIESIIQGIY